MDGVAVASRGAARHRVPARGRRAPQGPPRLRPRGGHRPRPGEQPVGARARDLALPAAVAAAGAVAYLIWAPASADLAAQDFRAGLGPSLVNTAWFGGHHTPAYSVLFPLLGALLGERLVGALAVVAASAAFGGLAGARLGVWFVPGALAALVSGRVTFLLGAAFAIAAVWAANPQPPSEKDQALWGGWLRVGVLGVLTSLASPVAALFAGLAGVALAVTGRRAGVVLAVAVAVPAALLGVAFSDGGTFPFAFSAFVPAFVAGVAVAVAAPRGSALAVGAALYAVLCLAVLVVPTPVGGNATRLGTLVAVPVAVWLLWPRRRVVLAALALPLAYWVLQPAVRDVARTAGDPSVDATYFAPLAERLRDGERPVRVAVPLTENKGETTHLARRVAIARGWERQVDRERNALFYADAPPTPAGYERWLRQNGVTHVALPVAGGVDFDPAGEDEARIVASAPPFLREVEPVAGWRLFGVRGAGSLGVASLGREAFTVAESGTVKVRFSPYWAITRGRGCVAQAPGGWTRVRVEGAGPVTVAPRFALGRIRAESPRCR